MSISAEELRTKYNYYEDHLNDYCKDDIINKARFQIVENQERTNFLLQEILITLQNIQINIK